MKPTQAQLEELLRVIAATAPGEIDCETFLERVGAYLESLEGGATPHPEFRQVAQHLDVCSECREEFEALIELYLRT